MYGKTLVEVPDDKGVHIKSAGRKNERYVYKHIEYYRNENGKPRNKSRLIGKLDNTTGRMHPNNNYFEIYNDDNALPDISIWDYGYSYLIMHVCHTIGLYESLLASFGAQTMEIIVMATYIIREGNAMDAIDDWQQRNYFKGFNKALTSQSCSRCFASITAKQRYSFFKNWINKSFTGGSVCYDVTSISSYSQGMTEVEHGYNRDGENLCQFNLGMFCDEKSKTPLYYSRYNGSLTDKPNLSYVLADVKDLGINRVKMILDGGFWSGECIKTLDTFCDAFTVGMPLYLKESEKILDIHNADIECYTNELKYRHIYCKQVLLEIHGVSGRVLIFYDALNHLKLCEEMSDRIEMLSSELARLKRYPKGKTKRYESYFKITKHDIDSGFDYKVDTEKVEKLRQNKGFFLLFSTDMMSTPSDILYFYRAKDADEKLFAQIKVDMECDRFRTHKQETTEGKTFVTFVACVLRSYMLEKLSNLISEQSTSLKKLFNQLSNITVITNSSGTGIRFLKALTKKQRQILEVFGVDNKILTSVREELREGYMESWDVYDKQGNVTGKVKTRNDIFDIGEYHLGVSLWIANKNGELLIQKRALIKRIKPGIWSITGGAAKAGESSRQACIREVAEEIGLSLNQQDIKLLSRSFGKDIIFDDYITIRDFPLTDIVLQTDEVSELKWVSIEEIKTLFYKGQFMLDDVNELIKVADYLNHNLAMQG